VARQLVRDGRWRNVRRRRLVGLAVVAARAKRVIRVGVTEHPLSRRGPEPDKGSAAFDVDRDRPPAASRYEGIDVGVIVDRAAVDPDDVVAGPQTCPFGGGVAIDPIDQRAGTKRLLLERHLLVLPRVLGRRTRRHPGVDQCQ